MENAPLRIHIRRGQGVSPSETRYRYAFSKQGSGTRGLIRQQVPEGCPGFTRFDPGHPMCQSCTMVLSCDYGKHCRRMDRWREEEKTISIIYPLKNRGWLWVNSFASLLKSVIPQDVKLEIVVADFESTDTTVEEWCDAARRLYADVSVKYLRVQETFNRSRGRNLGAQNASGNILFFLDADVVVHENFLAEIVAHVEPRSVYFPVFYQLHRGKPMQVKGNGRNHDTCNGKWLMASWGLFGVTVDDYLATGGYDESYLQWGGEDNAIAYRCKMLGFEIHKPRVRGLFHQWHPDVPQWKNRYCDMKEGQKAWPIAWPMARYEDDLTFEPPIVPFDSSRLR